MDFYFAINAENTDGDLTLTNPFCGRMKQRWCKGDCEYQVQWCNEARREFLGGPETRRVKYKDIDFWPIFFRSLSYPSGGSDLSDSD